MKEIEELRKYKVSEDEELLPEEKETYISFNAKKNSKIKVTTFQKEIINYLLKCNSLEVDRFYTNKKEEITYIEGHFSISHLRFKKDETESMNFLSRILP